MRPRRFDAFPFAGSPTELLLLECRLTELYDVMDGFIIVEGTVDHQGNSKPLNYREHEDRFAPWKDKITYVIADDMPTAEEEPHVKNPWRREHAQREWIGKGLEELGAEDDALIFQSDADEIPSVLAARNVIPRGSGMVSLRQHPHYWAIDWLDPNGWQGTVAGRYGAIKRLADNRPGGPFAAMRDSRNANPAISGGWHFSWLGRAAAAAKKIGSFCHPEIEHQIVDDLDWYWREGYHLGGGTGGRPVKMIPVEVDASYPKWMQDPANVPDTWRRPR